MIVMASEPAPNICASEVRAFFADACSEKDLADAYAITHNKLFWVEDNEYDYEIGTPEHQAACAITDEWLALMDEYKAKILEILKNEGVDIPQSGKVAVLAPFMARFGYIDGNGWWIKEDTDA